MAKHRTLSNALLSPEKMAFIKGQESDPPLAGEEQDLVHADAVVVPVVELANEQTSPPRVRLTKQSAAAGQGRSSREMEKSVAKSPANDGYVVSITTRLQARTADALRRAHLEQKLNRREPATQQEIIETAVQDWLRENSYLD